MVVVVALDVVLLEAVLPDEALGAAVKGAEGKGSNGLLEGTTELLTAVPANKESIPLLLNPVFVEGRGEMEEVGLILDPILIARVEDELDRCIESLKLFARPLFLV